MKARGAQVLSHFHELRLGFARLSLRSDEVIPFPFLCGNSFGFDTVAPAIGPVVVGSARWTAPTSPTQLADERQMRMVGTCAKPQRTATLTVCSIVLAAWFADFYV